MPSSYQHTVYEQPIYTTLENAMLSESTEYFDSVCGVNAIIPSNMESDSPYLTIIEQPADIFRYRYKSEKGFHGGMKGESATPNKKSYPTVKLENCPPSLRKKVVIKVSLYTNESDPKPHVYELSGKNCSGGKCEAKLDENYTAIFKSLAILSKKKEEVLEILKERRNSDYNSYDDASIEAEVLEEMKSINLDSAKLCFEAFSTDTLCTKVFSRPINNQKSAATGDLKIMRLSHCAGKCSGGEEVILLCDKIKKEDIKVRFFENPDEGDWEAFAEFNPAEIHHQVAIVFKTPRYGPANVHRYVCIELLRPSDQKCSEPRVFEYIPDEFPEISRKRKKLEFLGAHEDAISLFESSVIDSPQSINEPDISLMDLGILQDYPLLADFDFDFFSGDNHEDIENTRLGNQSIGSALYDFNIINQQNFVKPDSVNQISFSVDSLSLGDQACNEELQTLKKLKSLKDFIDGMKKILLNREASTYIHYAPHLIPAADENGNNMLHLAIQEQSENWNLIKTMLEMVPEDLINRQNKLKETPLHLAIKGNHPKILLVLLAKGGDPNIVDRNGNNCLHLAAKSDLINCLKVLMLPSKNRTWKHKVIKDINSVNYDGMSALHIATVKNFKDCIKILLHFKADVNLHEKKGGQTPLHLAIEQPSIFQVILKQPEIDINAVDFRGYTAVQLACVKNGKSFEVVSAQLKKDKDQIIKFLEKLNHKDGTFHSGCSGSDFDWESTSSSDFEDAVEDASLISDEEVVSKTVSTGELKEEKTSAMRTEEELQRYLDKNDNWKKLADLIGLDAVQVAMFDKESSPGLTTLRMFKELNHPCGLQTIIKMLQLVGLKEGVCILQKNS